MGRRVEANRLMVVCPRFCSGGIRCGLTQKEWFRRTGLDVINRRRGDLMAGKRRIERELMALMIGPDRTATDA
jgi:hypothetical protein